MAKRIRLCLIAGMIALLWAVTTPRTNAQGPVIWEATHEEPSEVHWYYPGGPGFGGGEFNSGCSSAAGAGWAGTTFAAWEDVDIPAPSGGGAFGLMLTSANTCGGPDFTSDYGAGTRMFRWKESAWDYPNQALYYKVWYYFPQQYVLTGDPNWYFLNIFQWKSVTATQNDVFFSVNIYNRLVNGQRTGPMYLQLRDVQGCRCNVAPVPTIDVPINQWFYIEGYYLEREELTNPTGRVTIWQGDAVSRRLLWDLQGVRTAFTGGTIDWSVNNYTSGLTPQPAYFFIDDAHIRLP